MLGEITQEIKELCGWLRAGKHENYEKAFAVHAVIVDQLAAKLRLEFREEHRFSEHSFTGKVFCPACELSPTEVDPRHNYVDSDWRDKAKKVLTGIGQ